MKFVYLAIILCAIGSLFAGDIKGIVTITGDPGTPMEIGEVYLCDSTRSIIDSTCIGEIEDLEYKFEDLDNGTYYIKLKTVKNESSITWLTYDWCTESTYYRVVLSGGGNGEADIVADEMSSDTTSCDD